jgi:hypothetical protein
VFDDLVALRELDEKDAFGLCRVARLKGTDRRVVVVAAQVAHAEVERGSRAPGDRVARGVGPFD